MCGRYTVAVDPQLLAERFDVALPEDIAPRFNVAPTDPVLALTERSAGRELMVARWGLVPHWAKDTKGGARMINARAETLAEKSAYRSLLAKSRCLILADGFYEWRLDPDGKKRPVRYTIDDGAPFGFAGLWTSRRDPESGESLRTCTIVTTNANALVAPGARPHARDPAARASRSSGSTATCRWKRRSRCCSRTRPSTCTPPTPRCS